MKVFLTGSKGYVGNVMARILIEKGHQVIGCDTEFYPQGFLDLKSPDIKSLKKDIRDLNQNDLENCDAVIHLAALSNDPIGEINPNLTNEINFKGTIHVAKLAKKIGASRFIFSSSCSIYGANDEVVDERSEMAPLTAYAKSKVDSENELLQLKDENFSPVILRNATVYGISPSQRIDLVVNNLIASVINTGKIKLLSDGTAWRPLLHVEDMARAFELMLNIEKDVISGQVFNVGENDENYKVREIAEMIGRIVPDSEIEFAKEASKDKRSYKVSFDKIKKIGFKTKWNLEKGIKDIYNSMNDEKFRNIDFKSKSYSRVAYIKWLLETRKLDENLRFKN